MIEALMAVTPERLMPEGDLEELEELLDAGDLQGAIEQCEDLEEVFLFRAIGAGLAKAPQGLERMESALSEELDAQATMLHQKLGYLNLIAGLAPMLGLMGTVQGMIDSFGTIATATNATPQQLAGGIYVALTTTFLGLIVAVPSSAAFTIFRGRLIKILNNAGMVCGNIMDRFRPVDEEFEG
jgi:biopolymer transport protein ExbB